MYHLPKSGDMIDSLTVTGGHGILKQTLSSEELLLDKKWFENTRWSMIDKMYLQRAAFCSSFQKIENTSLSFISKKQKCKKIRNMGKWNTFRKYF